MIEENNKYSMIFIAALVFTLVELIFTLPAIIIWSTNNSTPFNPLINYHSDLGNADINPNGACLYSIGSVVAGIALILFATNLNINTAGSYG